MAQDNKPKTLTVRGRLSYPRFTYADALKGNLTSQHPKKEDDVRPSANLLLELSQFEKVRDYLVDVFFPYAIELSKLGDSKKPGLTANQVKKLKAELDNYEDWEKGDGVMGLLYPVPEKTRDLAPEAVVSLKVNGFKKQDFELKAIVRGEDELAVPDADVVIPERGMILPLNDTTHEMYPGSIVAATLDMWGFSSAGQPGVTANTSTLVFAANADRFGGGGSMVDEDEMFLDD